MRLKYFHAAILLCAAIALAACNSTDSKVNTTAQNQNKAAATTETVYSDGARRMTVPEAQEAIKRGQVFVVDVRNQGSYDAGHIPGSKLIPEGEILVRSNELPKDKTILTYCS